MLPVVRKACELANSIGLQSRGAVALVAILILAMEGGAAETREALQPVAAVLRDREQPEANRLETANRMLFDLEESLPPDLRASETHSVPTPELPL